VHELLQLLCADLLHQLSPALLEDQHQCCHDLGPGLDLVCLVLHSLPVELALVDLEEE
jgi:hypothetical protein